MATSCLAGPSGSRGTLRDGQQGAAVPAHRTDESDSLPNGTVVQPSPGDAEGNQRLSTSTQPAGHQLRSSCVNYYIFLQFV